MPRLNQWAERAIRFENHISGGNMTRSGVFSLLYGLPANWCHPFAAAGTEPVLMGGLRRQGYRFGLFASASLSAMDIAQTAFTELRDEIRQASGRTTVDRDLDMERFFYDFLARQDPAAPFFAFLFYDALHAHQSFPDHPQPFQPSLPWDYSKLGRHTDPEPYMNTYRNAALSMDARLALLLERLKEGGWLENSVVILTGDHGEEVNDSQTNAWGHGSRFNRWQIQTPLPLFWPGQPPAIRLDRTRHYDVAPALMEEILGVDAQSAPDYCVGENILRPADRQVSVCLSYNNDGHDDTAIVDGDQVFVLRKYGMMHAYTMDGDPLPQASIPPRALAEAVDIMRRFR